MSQVSTVYKLPTGLRRELKRRIRSNGYGGFKQHADWLREQGYNLSKSAVHRFGKGLKESDERHGIDVEITLERGADLVDLWDELDDLRDRERELLQQIRRTMRGQSGIEPQNP